MSAKRFEQDIRRNLAKINYRIHTDAIQQHLIPAALSALFIAEGLPQSQRLERLNRIAIGQMTLLANGQTKILDMAAKSVSPDSVPMAAATMYNPTP